MDRRGFLQSILAAGVAPAFIGSSVLMPVRKLWTPPEHVPTFQFSGIEKITAPRNFAGWDGVMKVTNDGPCDLTVLGVDVGGFYTPAGSVIVRPGETRFFRAGLPARLSSGDDALAGDARQDG